MKYGRALLIVFGVLLVMQLYRPAKTNPISDPAKSLASHSEIPADLHQALQHSCGDCHSNNTRWPWYSNIAPMSWMVIDDVNEGRRHFNMAEWGDYPAKRQLGKLDQICEQVKKGDMPLVSYTWIHHGTKLTPEQRDAICGWANAEQQRITSATGVTAPPRENTSNYQAK